ncbi:2,3-bisphosphoglycerate-independent phosphoglycerate mutase [Candidatus Bathyarchaeota archaeon]|nr:2,3-bisphosphoglycerate-independent phosphoglycerate mutase [Candidatus Bathyarchaeota archaeon]
MADRPVKELDWKTPLEFARKPTLNRIAETGICGILDPIAPGIPPGSDTATLALLGYDAVKTYSGRGALEALGSNVKVLPGDVAFRCNFATVNQNQTVLDRRAGRIENRDSQKLAESLSQVKLKTPNARFLFKSTIQHRAVLVIRGPRLSANISDSDPGTTGEKVMDAKPLDDSPEAKLTARIVNTLTREFHKCLTSHPVNRERVKRGLPPANMILCRGAGTLPNVKSLAHIYGIKTSCVAATPLVRGVCRAVGMKTIDVQGATGTLQTDYLAKARATVQALRSNDFVLLHIKATDVASHDSKAKQKAEAIEKLDNMLNYLIEHVDLNSVYLAVTADHTTSSATGNHEGDPVPIAITGPSVRRDSVKEYDERSCAGGGLHRIRGVDLMPILMNLLGKTSKFGA